jgi:hypothetical protein
METVFKDDGFQKRQVVSYILVDSFRLTLTCLIRPSSGIGSRLTGRADRCGAVLRLMAVQQTSASRSSHKGSSMLHVLPCLPPAFTALNWMGEQSQEKLAQGSQYRCWNRKFATRAASENFQNFAKRHV